MEPSEETSPLAGDNLLEVPSLNDAYEDDEEVKATFKPRFSPQPRRRSSVSSDDAESEAPPNVSRKVSFADAFGLDLVSVKEFDTWEIPTTSQNDTFEDDVAVVDEFYLLSRFEVPSREEVLQRVHTQKVLLEAVEFFPGSASLSGIIRVLNVSFEKRVFVRMTLDDWLSYYDILAEYVPNSCDGETDQFSFRMSLVPPYLKDGAKLDFCIRYESSAGTFWANNHGNNYQLLCHKKEAAVGADKEPEDVSDKYKKSCLKTSQSKEDEILTLSDEDTWDYSNLSDVTIPQIVYPPEDDAEEIDESIDVKAMQHGGHNERELELLLSQHLIRIRDASSGDKGNRSASEHNHSPSDEQGCEQELTLQDTNTDLRQNSLNVCGFLKDILEDDKPLAYDTHLESTSPKALEVSEDALSPECGGSEASVEDLGGSSNASSSPHTDDRSGTAPGPYQADRANGQTKESIEMAEETGEGATREHALHTAAVYPRVRSWTEYTETLKSEKSPTPSATSASSNANPSQIEGSQLCAIKEQESSSLLEIHVPGVNTAHIHKNDEVSADMLPSLTGGKQSLSVVNTYSQSEDGLTMTPVSDEGGASGVHEIMANAQYDENVAAEENTNKGQEPMSPAADPHWKGDSNEIRNTAGGTERKDPCSLGGMKTVLPLHCDSVFTTGWAHSAHNTETIPFANEEEQATENLSSTERRNEGVSESMFFAKEEAERTVSASFSAHVESEKAGVAERISFPMEVNEETIEIAASEHLQSQSGEAGEDLSFVKEDDEKDIVTSFFKHRECKKEGVAENIAFAREADEETIELSQSEHIETQNEETKEDIQFVMEGDKKDIVIVTSENVESETEVLAEDSSFSRKANTEIFEISASLNLQCQNEEAEEEDVSFVKEDNQNDTVTLYFKQRACEKEGVEENITFLRSDDEHTFKYSASEHIGSTKEDPKEDISFVMEGDEKAIVISSSQYIDSEIAVVAGNISFSMDDDEETMNIATSQHRESVNEDAEEDIPVIKEDNEKNTVISYSQHRESGKDVLVEKALFAGKDNEERMAVPAFQDIESENEEAEGDIPFAKKVDENNIDNPLSVERKNEGAEENISFAREYNEKTVQTWGSQKIGIQNECLSCSEHIEGEDAGQADIIFCGKDNEEEKCEILASEHIESQNEEAEDIYIAKEDDMKDIVTASSEHIEGEREDVAENISFAMNLDEDNNEISVFEHIECQNEEAEDISIAKEDDMKDIVSTSSEHREGEREDISENISFAMNLHEDNNEISVSEHIEYRNEEADDTPIAKENDMKDTVTASSEYIDGEREDVAENISFAMNLDEDNNKTSVFEHIECQNEDAEDISIAKEDGTKDIVTECSEHIENETEVADFEDDNISFARVGNEEALQISSSERIESEYAEAEEHIGHQNVVMSTTLNLPQLESLFRCVRSEQPECMMSHDSHRTENVDILDIQAMETDYNGNESEITNKETKSQEMWSGTQGSLHIGSVEELYISQETVSFDDYVLVDANIGEQVEACPFLSNETPSEGTLANLYADVKEKCNETVKSERQPGEGTFTAMKETKIGMFLDLHNDNVSISYTNRNENQDSLKVHVEDAMKKDLICSVDVQQNTTESNIISISPNDETTGLVLTKDGVFQQKLYIDESPEQQQHVLEKPASEASSSSSSNVNHHQKTWFINVSAECNLSVGNFPDLSSLDTRELSNNSDFPQPVYRPEASLGPMILISEAADEREERHSDSEELLSPTAVLQLQGGKHQQLHQMLQSESVSNPKNEEAGQSNESVILKCIGYKVLYFLLFMIFAVIIYQCDSLLCSVPCFCSIYWLFFEKGTYKESVKKQ